MGSTFTVRLPRVLEAVEPVAAVPAPARHPGSETILLVEDEDSQGSDALGVERQGYTVLACADGMAAVALAELNDRRIDLLLTDVVMPGMRGYDVAKRIAGTRPEIKILYMSGYAEEALIGRLRLPPCVDREAVRRGRARPARTRGARVLTPLVRWRDGGGHVSVQ